MTAPCDATGCTTSLTYEAAVDYLFGRINYERVPTTKYSTDDFQLFRMSTLLERLGNPQLTIPAVHITGTKGKGSTAAMVAALWQAGGHTVGLFTSPHLERFEERMTVNGQLPSESQIIRLVSRLMEVAVDLELSEETRPTFFELSTALAWMVFQAAGCDLVVLEVGLGGRLDTTNLCRPLATAITSVSRDHMRLLGETLELIAREKAGIIKPGVPCVTGVESPAVRAVIEDVCRDRGAACHRLGQEIQILQAQPDRNSIGPARWVADIQTAQRVHPAMAIPLAGEFQIRNAALALALVDLVGQQLGQPLSAEQIRSGLAQVVWPLRMETVRHHPMVLLDAAHNDASIQELCRTVQSIPARQRTLIFGTSRDKEAAAMLRLVGGAFDRILITRYTTNPRAWPVEELAEVARSIPLPSMGTSETIAEALRLALSDATADDLICVAGSFFLAAEARSLFAATL